MNRPIVFIRGLNTHQDEHVHIGLKSYGHMNARVEKFLQTTSRPYLMAPVEDHLELSGQVARIKNFLNQQPLIKSDPHVHIVGHSFGGIIGRAILRERDLSRNILSVTTIGTPHTGSDVADAIVSGKGSLLKILVRGKQNYFVKLTRSYLAEFNAHGEDSRVASIVAQLPYDEWSWPFKFFRGVAYRKFLSKEGDGLILPTDQIWGKKLGTYALDHLDQIGFHDFRNRKLRLEKSALFHEMWHSIFSHLNSVEKIRVNSDK